MKNYWVRFTEIFGRTIFHPQFIILSFAWAGVLEIKKRGEVAVLDIGSGRAPYKDYLLKYIKSYTGVDHPKTSKLYKSSQKPDFYADANSLPFKKESFDIAAMLQVLEYLDEPQLAFNEAFRVLKKGGSIILTTPFMYPIHDGNLDKNRFTKPRLEMFLKDAKFRISKSEYQGSFFDFWIQSFLVFYFKNVNSISRKNRFSKVFSLFLLFFGLIATPFLNLIAIGIRHFVGDKNTEFPLDVLIVAKK
ncbi:MAG: class I SAM-dependent methyltransferase [Candidatus Woesebacteria bacterium]|nr:MAG: class I SAM-dependent methyltransferase [Candidatus Woesebacteria bacterium]